MKDKVSFIHHDGKVANAPERKQSQFEAMAAEIERLKAQISRMEKANEVLWSNSVVKVIFKNEIITRKYRLKVESFLKNILEKGEDFIVNCQISNNTEQEFEEVHQSFHIDKTNKSCNEKTVAENVPHYSSTYDDILHCNNIKVVETPEEEKPQAVTCFNCLGNHHMKMCPVEIDRLRIAANKKDILVGNTVRYHDDEQKNSMKPGVLSNQLKKALGLKRDQLPIFIYHMRVLGYPPGWMNESVFETSGLSLYDVEGKAVKEGSPVSSHKEVVYDGSKFIDYPGFNSTVPAGIKDEWESLKMPPLQPHQQLSEALKAPNTINSKAVYKKRSCAPSSDSDSKRVKNGVEESNLHSNSTPKQNSNHRNRGNQYTPKTPEKIRHSVSISSTPGTPILKLGNPYERLPEADKFAQGITEHLPFENLPDSVGTFEKMRGVLSNLQKKMFEIDNRR